MLLYEWFDECLCIRIENRWCHSALHGEQKAKRFVQLRDDLWSEVAQIAKRAALEITKLSHQGGLVRHKSDKSPVTEADNAAHELIVAALTALTPTVTIISEESELHPPLTPYWWCVDPLDGTRSFVRGSGEYTVNIALMKYDAPMLGVIACPLDEAIYAGVVGRGLWRQLRGQDWYEISGAKRTKAARAIISSATSGAVMKAWLKEHGVTETMHMSSARKFCVLAEGGAEFYPRFGTTMEWDTAAGHALLLAGGGDLLTMEGQKFCYGKAGFINGSFVAYAGR